jgi:hypothetical protein
LRLEVAGAAALLVFFGRPTPSATRYARLFLRELRDVDCRTKTFSCSICGADGVFALEEPCKDTGTEDYRLDQRVSCQDGRSTDGARRTREGIALPSSDQLAQAQPCSRNTDRKAHLDPKTQVGPFRYAESTSDWIVTRGWGTGDAPMCGTDNARSRDRWRLFPIEQVPQASRETWTAPPGKDGDSSVASAEGAPLAM